MKKNLLVLLIFGLMFSVFTLNTHAQTLPQIDLNSMTLNQKLYNYNDNAELTFKVTQEISKIEFIFGRSEGMNVGPLIIFRETFSSPTTNKTYTLEHPIDTTDLTNTYTLYNIAIFDSSGTKTLYTNEDYNFSHLDFTIEYKQFSDIPKTHWAYKQINTLAFLKVVNGYDDGTFKPNNPITRAEAVKIIASMFVHPELPVVNPDFKDIPTTHWAYQWIAGAYTLGFITGYEDGTFKPNNNITRGEVATLLSRIYDYPNGTIQTSYKDVPITHWAYNAINNLSSLGVVKGYEDGTFKPNNNITRVEFVVMTLNYDDVRWGQ